MTAIEAEETGEDVADEVAPAVPAAPPPKPPTSSRPPARPVHRAAVRLPGEGRFEPRPDRPRGDGFGMFVVGGIFAGLGLVAEGVRIAGLVEGDVYLSLFAGLPASGCFTLSLPFFGAGMHRRTFVRIYDAHGRGEALPRAPSNARIGVGATLTILGSAAMLAGFSIPTALPGGIATWTGYPVLLAGTLLLAEAQGRRRARKRLGAVVLPARSPGMIGIVVSGAF